MRTTLKFAAGDVLPTLKSVLVAQGIPPWKTPADRIVRLAEKALSAYRETAEPAAVWMDIPRPEFMALFQANGKNAAESPVGPVAGSADDLALFAVTLGQRISDEISLLFERNDFAAGALLDAAASEGADLAAAQVERAYRDHLRQSSRFNSRQATLRFSPGYCGWHIRGQEELFGALDPSAIGIRLNESCLMQPLKSVSGVVVSGNKEIFYFEDTFSFCRDCATHTCRDRIGDVMNQ